MVTAYITEVTVSQCRLATAAHVGHVDVASSIQGLGCGQVWTSVRLAMLSILYGSHSSSISFYGIQPRCEYGIQQRCDITMVYQG